MTLVAESLRIPMRDMRVDHLASRIILAGANVRDSGWPEKHHEVLYHLTGVSHFEPRRKPAGQFNPRFGLHWYCHHERGICWVSGDGTGGA